LASTAAICTAPIAAAIAENGKPPVIGNAATAFEIAMPVFIPISKTAAAFSNIAAFFLAFKLSSSTLFFSAAYFLFI
jgi:hypothetical protein